MTKLFFRPGDVLSAASLNRALASVLATIQTATGSDVAAAFRAQHFAASDETTALLVASGLIELPAIADMTLQKVKVSLRTASSSGSVQVNVRVNGTAVTASPITLADGVKIATATVLALTTIEEDDLITVDVVAAGTDAAGLKVALIGAAQ